MKRFEYCQVYFNPYYDDKVKAATSKEMIAESDKMIDLFNILGLQGWELVSLGKLDEDSHIYWFKREIE